MANSRISVCDLLGVLFVAYKLAGIIAWSWWWVLAPWGVEVLVAIVAAVIAVRHKRDHTFAQVARDVHRQMDAMADAARRARRN